MLTPRIFCLATGSVSLADNGAGAPAGASDGTLASEANTSSWVGILRCQFRYRYYTSAPATCVLQAPILDV